MLSTSWRTAKDRAIMMPQRQEVFRADYRRRIPPWYNGVLHAIVISAIGAAALAYFIPHIHNPAGPIGWSSRSCSWPAICSSGGSTAM